MAMDLSWIGREVGPFEIAWGADQVILYALGVGAHELQFATEDSEGHRSAGAPDLRHHRRQGRRRGPGVRALVRQLRRAPGRAPRAAGRGVRRAPAGRARALDPEGRRDLRQAGRRAGRAGRDGGRSRHRAAPVPELQLALHLRRGRLRRRSRADERNGAPAAAAGRRHRRAGDPSRAGAPLQPLGRSRADPHRSAGRRAAPASSARSCTASAASASLAARSCTRRAATTPRGSEAWRAASRSPPIRATSW